MFLIKVQVYPRNSGKDISYPDKKIPRPGPTRNKIPRPDPKIFLKMFPDPGPVSVRSGPVRGNSGFRVAPQVFSTNIQTDTPELPSIKIYVNSPLPDDTCVY